MKVHVVGERAQRNLVSLPGQDYKGFERSGEFASPMEIADPLARYVPTVARFVSSLSSGLPSDADN